MCLQARIAKSEVVESLEENLNSDYECLSSSESDKILEYITSGAPKCLDSLDVIPSSWMGSGNWEKTPLHQLFVICGGLKIMDNERLQQRHDQWVQQESALLFGTFVMLAAIQHPDQWIYNKDPEYMVNGVSIGSNIYWREIKKFA